MTFTNKQYDVLKKIAVLILPLAEFIPARVDAFVRVDGHVPAAQPSAYGEKRVDSEHLNLLARKLRGVIDALDRNDSAEFDRDVRFVYGS